MNKKTVTPKDALISLLCVHKSCEHLGIYPIIKEHFIKIGDFMEQNDPDVKDASIPNSNMKRSTIQTETIDVLSRSALTSVRVHYISEAIKNTDTSFEIIHILTSALISAEREVNVHRDQHMLREMSLTPSMFLDNNQKFIGVDVAGAGKDTGVYSDEHGNMAVVHNNESGTKI